MLTHPLSSPPTLPHSFPVRLVRSQLSPSTPLPCPPTYPMLQMLKSRYPMTNLRCVYCWSHLFASFSTQLLSPLQVLQLQYQLTQSHIMTVQTTFNYTQGLMKAPSVSTRWRKSDRGTWQQPGKETHGVEFQIPSHSRWYCILQPLVHWPCSPTQVCGSGHVQYWVWHHWHWGRTWHAWLTTTSYNSWTGIWSGRPPRA